ncbi:MAG: glutathione S-transferase family protein [Pseudomonadota bacterium]
MYRLIGSLRNRAFRVAWLLEELGEVYELVEAQPHSETVLSVDPGGKLPVLETDDGALWDSIAIMNWLADRHGRFTHPASSFARAQQNAVTGQILDEIESLLWMAGRHSFILPEDRRVPEIKDSLRWEFTRNCKRIAMRLRDGPFLAGDAPTVPDFLWTHCATWAHSARFDVNEPRLINLAERMRARQAYAKVAKLRG